MESSLCVVVVGKAPRVTELLEAVCAAKPRCVVVVVVMVVVVVFLRGMCSLIRTTLWGVMFTLKWAALQLQRHRPHAIPHMGSCRRCGWS